MSAPARSLLKNPQSHGPHDALGSVRAITDDSGAVVGSYTYGAWGETLAASDPSGFEFAYKFVGGLGVRHDGDSGLYYMRHRWYDAGLGRFLSRDPVGQPGENRYLYANTNPVMHTDPSGLYTFTQELLTVLKNTGDPILSSESFMSKCMNRVRQYIYSPQGTHFDPSDNLQFKFLRRARQLLAPGNLWTIGYTTTYQPGDPRPGYAWTVSSKRYSQISELGLEGLKGCETEEQKIEECAKLFLHEMAHILIYNFRYNLEWVPHDEPFIETWWKRMVIGY